MVVGTQKHATSQEIQSNDSQPTIYFLKSFRGGGHQQLNQNQIQPTACLWASALVVVDFVAFHENTVDVINSSLGSKWFVVMRFYYEFRGNAKI